MSEQPGWQEFVRFFSASIEDLRDALEDIEQDKYRDEHRGIIKGLREAIRWPEVVEANAMVNFLPEDGENARSE
jgi:hypothetical protein